MALEGANKQFVVVQLTPNGLAEKKGIQLDDHVVKIEINNANPLGRGWGYGAGLSLLALIVMFQWRRRLNGSIS